ncbi:uncharacterized protein MYCFIDRAFT_90525 [Pseudocercospora fijiensis CIRAD86]|uniref:Uncharacterized protein n=1 Tax=Pseudocercospora fijiensis (strain CIRAD86) TaxID=383855 RepID=M3AJH2_PSEFD|nr:uncharacterized protein MYCFIDRAFT_90525 [Pseudocercospora fijiensis CIRAD86]EME77308.1 hypothetical protein MYCFIDRAFT_90525 [Pseudocercospora fijiensis CIRAD86]
MLQRAAGGSALTGGLIGGGVVFAAGYAYYHFSGAKTLVQTSASAKQYADQVAEQVKSQLKELKPTDSGNALNEIKSFAQKYATWVPGGKEFIDKSFKDLEDIQQKHGDEVNDLAKKTYDELKEVADKKGASLEVINDVWQILSKRLQELSSIAGDAGQQILDNHPEAKEKLGGSFDQLKQLGDRLGPEAKKQVDETFKEASDIAKAGFSADSANRIYKLVQDKAEQLKKTADQSWQSGLEQIKPMLEKNPKVKDTESLERYVKQTKQKADQYTSGGLSTWLGAIGGGSQIIPQLQKLKEAADQKGPEAQQLAKNTIHDISKVLEDRAKQAEELLKK